MNWLPDRHLPQTLGQGPEREPWLTLRGLPWNRRPAPKRRPGRLKPEPGRPRGPVSGEAVNALAQVIGWADELAAGAVTRADIARREGLSRARVTQLMRLLDIPNEHLVAIRSGKSVLSIRAALRLALPRPS